MSFFDRNPAEDLLGFFLFERFPAPDTTVCLYKFGCEAVGGLQDVLLSRLCSAGSSQPSWSSFGGVFHYASPVETTAGSTVTAVVLSKNFHPAGLLPLSEQLASLYLSTGRSGPATLKAWLQLYVSGELQQEGASASPTTLWSAAESCPDLSKGYRASGFKALLSAVGAEVIFLWSALLLKKRVAVYAPNAADAARTAAMLPVALAGHRVKSSVHVGDVGVRVFPNICFRNAAAVTDSDTRARVEQGLLLQRQELLGAAGEEAAGAGGAAVPGFYILGTSEEAVLQQGGELWDVCVDLADNTVLIAEQARSEWRGDGRWGGSALLLVALLR